MNTEEKLHELMGIVEDLINTTKYELPYEDSIERQAMDLAQEKLKKLMDD